MDEIKKELEQEIRIKLNCIREQISLNTHISQFNILSDLYNKLFGNKGETNE